MGIFYRLGQFWQNVTAKPLSVAQTAVIRPHLSEAEFALYQRYAAEDQQHTFRAFCLVRGAGGGEAVLTAVLLHDVGKARVRLTVWERTAVVLAKRLAPSRLAAWGGGAATGWKRPFVVRAQHPAWGAEMAANAGAAPTVVWLIEKHQDMLARPQSDETEEEKLLRLLQWADDQS